MSDVLIECKQLSRYFTSKAAIQNINWQISAGEIWGLLGANGAGKSTLISTLLGLSPSEGEIAYAASLGPTHRGSIAAVSDLATLPTWMTLRQLIDFMAGVNPLFSTEKALSNLARTELKEKQKPKAMSKGQLVQAHLALIMATDAKVLILDEPTLGLDQVFRDQFYRHLMEWYQDGERSVIIASHELPEIEPLLSHVMVLDHGQQALQLSMEQLYDQFRWVDEVSVNDHILKRQQLLKQEYALVRDTSAGDRGQSASLLDVFLGLQKEHSHV